MQLAVCATQFVQLAVNSMTYPNEVIIACVYCDLSIKEMSFSYIYKTESFGTLNGYRTSLHSTREAMHGEAFYFLRAKLTAHRRKFRINWINGLVI